MQKRETWAGGEEEQTSVRDQGPQPPAIHGGTPLLHPSVTFYEGHLVQSGLGKKGLLNWDSHTWSPAER